MSQESLVKKLSSVSVLAIDEFGDRLFNNTETDRYDEREEISTIVEIIDERYRKKLPTIIATNLSADNVKKIIGPAAFSRSCKLVMIFDGEDKRNPSW